MIQRFISTSEPQTPETDGCWSSQGFLQQLRDMTTPLLMSAWYANMLALSAAGLLYSCKCSAAKCQ